MHAAHYSRICPILVLMINRYLCVCTFYFLHQSKQHVGIILMSTCYAYFNYVLLIFKLVFFFSFYRFVHCLGGARAHHESWSCIFAFRFVFVVYFFNFKINFLSKTFKFTIIIYLFYMFLWCGSPTIHHHYEARPTNHPHHH